MTTAEIAAEINRRWDELNREGGVNRQTTLEGIITNLREATARCIYCNALFTMQNDTDRAAMADHIMSCEKSPLVKAIHDLQAPVMDFMTKIDELLKERAIAVDSLTRTQLADAILQAIQCGDFQRLVIQHEDKQNVVYIPFAREQELRLENEKLGERIIELEHRLEQS